MTSRFAESTTNTPEKTLLVSLKNKQVVTAGVVLLFVTKGGGHKRHPGGHFKRNKDELK